MWNQTNIQELEPVFYDKEIIDAGYYDDLWPYEISITHCLYVVSDGSLVYARHGPNYGGSIEKVWADFDAYKADVQRGYYTTQERLLDGQLVQHSFWFNETRYSLSWLEEEVDYLGEQLKAVQRALDLHLY